MHDVLCECMQHGCPLDSVIHTRHIHPVGLMNLPQRFLAPPEAGLYACTRHVWGRCISTAGWIRLVCSTLFWTCLAEQGPPVCSKSWQVVLVCKQSVIHCSDRLVLRLSASMMACCHMFCDHAQTPPVARQGTLTAQARGARLVIDANSSRNSSWYLTTTLLLSS
jgi:hypothetical protein